MKSRLVLLLLLLLWPPALWGDTLSRVSVGAGGAQGDGESKFPSVSSDGRYVAFASAASNLIAGDTNGHEDIFVYDNQTGTTTRVSVASNGGEGNNASYTPVISGNGRYVIFESLASNLVAGDTNNSYDVLVHDRVTAQTNRLGSNSLVSFCPCGLSSDGRYAAFTANDLGGAPFSGKYIFLYDTQESTASQVHINNSGTPGNGGVSSLAVSADGSWLAYSSTSTNLCDGDTNGLEDVFLREQASGNTIRVSVTSSGVQSNGQSRNAAISGDGRYVAFDSMATNLVSPYSNPWHSDVYVHDRSTGQTSLASQSSTGEGGNSISSGPAVSGNGRYIAFSSYSDNLVSSDTNGMQDVFVRDRQEGKTYMLSSRLDLLQANKASYWPALSSEARFVAFTSEATNLVGSDTNGKTDVFLRDWSSLADDPLPPPDSDGDGTPDPADGCPDDPGKVSPGQCGCSAPDIDTDLDSVADCVDLCPADNAKGEPGICGCGTPDFDTDFDGTPDCIDGCDYDGAKTEPLICGCNTADTDADGDSTPACNDQCDEDDQKTEPGYCGCGASDEDANRNRIPDCLDPKVPPDEPVTPDTEPIAPFVVTKGSSVTVYMERFSGASLGAAARAAQLSIRYELIVEKTGKGARRTSSVQRRVSNRNRVLLEHMPAGQYNARYRVWLTRGSKIVASTQYSPSSSFTVNSRPR